MAKHCSLSHLFFSEFAVPMHNASYPGIPWTYGKGKGMKIWFRDMVSSGNVPTPTDHSARDWGMLIIAIQQAQNHITGKCHCQKGKTNE